MPTRVPSNGQETAPDIDRGIQSLLASAEWTARIEQGSDHFPIIFTLPAATSKMQVAENQTYVNSVKAKSANITTEIEQAFNTGPKPTNLVKVGRVYAISLRERRNVSSARITEIIPCFSSSGVDKVRERNELGTCMSHPA